MGRLLTVTLLTLAVGSLWPESGRAQLLVHDTGPFVLRHMPDGGSGNFIRLTNLRNSEGRIPYLTEFPADEWFAGQTHTSARAELVESVTLANGTTSTNRFTLFGGAWEASPEQTFELRRRYRPPLVFSGQDEILESPPYTGLVDPTL